MKKLLALTLLLLMTACATSEGLSVQNCMYPSCDISAVHHHVIY